MRWVLAVAVLRCLLGCGDGSASSDPLRLTPFVDLDPDPQVVEVDLRAAPASAEYLDGKPGDVWAYRDGSAPGEGTVPGPLLDVNRGDHVVVHFTNELPDETTIHWHGLAVPNLADGTPATQAPVEPGATFTYEFDVPDAGLYWYHPHVAADVQIERGLYGPVLVRGGVEPEVTAERVLMVDDVKLEATGELSTTDEPLDLMLGRQGNVLLVNGHRGATIAARAGARERWRVVNTANGRYFNLAVPGAEILVIGWDGGLLPEPYTTPTLLVAPGERYDVLVDLAGEPGDVIPLQTLHYDRGHDIPDPGPLDLLSFELGDRADPVAALPASWGRVERIPTDDTTPGRSLILSEEEAGLAEPRFFINGEQYPDSTPTDATAGGVEVWSIQNDSGMDHPFHLHGMSFQVLDTGGEPAEHLGWKDTVNVPQETTLRFAVRYGEPGIWMYHCHILEHAERGMMGELRLTAP
jgi:FtsP/CotA-like multicopper oxidase with cupredoxin domain